MRKAGLTLLVAAAVLLASCTAEPTNRAQVCADFDALAKTIRSGNGFGNPVFDAVGDLASTAGRYQGAENLSQTADRLERIADSESTTVLDLENATVSLASLCGGPLSFRAYTN